MTIGSLAILGAGGHGRVVADCAQVLGFTDITFFDDGLRELTGPWRFGGPFDALLQNLSAFDNIFVAIGDNKTRLAALMRLEGKAAPLCSLVHPAATVSQNAEIALACFIAAGAVVEVNARIGLGCIINTSASVNHDCVLASGVHISPGAHLAGNVKVGENSWIGIGAVVREGTCIGDRVIVGAGAVVISDVAEGKTVVGVPAQSIEGTP